MDARRMFRASVLWLALCGGFAALPVVGLPSVSAASEIKIIVNKDPVTSYQIKERAAFLKLRNTKGDLTAQATDELINEALKKQEIRRRGIAVPDAAVDQAFQKFASDNKMTPAQLDQVLTHFGFSVKGFKAYIKVQMGWGQAVQASLRSGAGGISEQDVVQRMLAQGGDKPSTTEYTLQQVVFVIPPAKVAALKAQRLQEANALRARFRSCPENYQFAKGLRDVTIRELGRVEQPALPDRWKDEISKAQAGSTTPPKESELGIEYIAICSTRQVSDDKVAALVFQSQDREKGGASAPDAKLLKSLRDKAAIIKR